MAPDYTEDDARQALLDRRGHLLQNIFQGGKLEFTATGIASLVTFGGKNVYTIVKETRSIAGGGISATAEGSSAASGLLNGVFDGADMRSLLSSVPLPDGIQRTVTQFADCIPGVAQLQSGLSLLKSLAYAAKHAWNHHYVASKTGALRASDPRAALAAVCEIITRARNAQLAEAAIEGGHMVASAGGFFLDGGAITGPATAALKAFATLTQRIYLLVRDIKEKKAANDALANPQSINSRIFQKSPVLGCYVITEGSAFDLLNFLVSEIGQDGWMRRVEQLLPDLTYVQDNAAQYARQASLQMAGIRTNMWTVRGLTRTEKMKRWLKKKVGMKV